MEGVTARNGGDVVGINSKFGDTATLKNVCADTKNPCVLYDGCAGGCEPKEDRHLLRLNTLRLALWTRCGCLACVITGRLGRGNPW